MQSMLCILRCVIYVEQCAGPPLRGNIRCATYDAQNMLCNLCVGNISGAIDVVLRGATYVV
eukprot:8437348-Pyramimonas_sp.AAC.1